MMDEEIKAWLKYLDEKICKIAERLEKLESKLEGETLGGGKE
jgi:hypothetical protein